MSLKSSAPLVSVVVAAYNSSQRLSYAVKSALNQSYKNLEIVVIGDNCTDDSEATIRAFGNSRIRWENLPSNWGEQSVPSNRGIDIANGEFIFFLNQDDLWLRDHIKFCLEEIEYQKLDLVWSKYLILPPMYRPNSKDTQPILVGDFAPEIGIDPYIFIPASCTGWRRDALESIGGWRTAGEVVVSPSQDLVWRASRAGLKCGKTQSPSVLVLWSGDRQGSYLTSYRPEDNEFWFSALRSSPEMVINEVTKAKRKNFPQLARMAYSLLGPVITFFGLHPRSLEIQLRHGFRGGFINYIRARNSLSRKSFRKPISKEERI